MTDRETTKRDVLKQVSNGNSLQNAGTSKYLIGDSLIHVRYCSPDAYNSPRYKFNINPNTLSSDFELWICGSSDAYYLIPVRIMRQIYDDPEAYVDNHHPEIRVVSVNVFTDSVTYASGGKSINISKYLRGIAE